jgi:hypothetical protein
MSCLNLVFDSFGRSRSTEITASGTLDTRPIRFPFQFPVYDGRGSRVGFDQIEFGLKGFTTGDYPVVFTETRPA